MSSTAVTLDGTVSGEIVSLAELSSSAGFAILGSQPVEPVRELAAFEALAEDVRAEALWWQTHLADVIHGRPFDGVGRNYDVRLTSLRQREQAKVAELAEEGRAVSLRRVQRLRRRYQHDGLFGLVDGRLAASTHVGSRVDPRVREALTQVLKASTLESTGSADRVRVDVERVLAERHDEAVPLPSRATLYRLIGELREGRHALGSARTRQTMAQQPQRAFSGIRPGMPGEIVQVDSTPVDVAVRLNDNVTGRVELSGMVDVATRTIMSVVVRPTTKAVDLGALLARAITPERMRPGWSDAVRMSRSVLPYQAMQSVDDRLDEDAAARPVIMPQTIVMDHGKPYTSRAFEYACRIFGINLQPAHPDTPTDKPTIERTLGSVATLFVQYLPGYLGRSVERRGQDADQAAVLSLPELQAALDQWVVTVWQNRKHEGLRDPLSNEVVLTPNEMYAAMTRIAGYVPVPVSADTFVELLPWEYRTIGPEGVQINRRRYDCTALNPYRRQRARTKGGLWEVRYDPYDVTRVYVRVDGEHGHFVTAMWRQLRYAPTAFGADVWRAAQQQVAERQDRAGTEEQIARAAHEILTGHRERAAPTPRSRKHAARVRARDQASAAGCASRNMPPTPPEPATPEPISTQNGSPAAPPTLTLVTASADEPDGQDEQPMDVVPLPVYDARKEAETWW